MVIIAMIICKLHSELKTSFYFSLLVVFLLLLLFSFKRVFPEYFHISMSAYFFAIFGDIFISYETM